MLIKLIRFYLNDYHRPRNAKEVKDGSHSVVECDGHKREITIKQDLSTNTSTTKTFSFDKVFPPDAKQLDVYKAVVQPTLDEVLLGYNCTIFA